MAISETIESIKTHIEDAYDSAEAKGAEIPEEKNLENLAQAISSIEGGTVTEDYIYYLQYFNQNLNLSDSNVQKLLTEILSKWRQHKGSTFYICSQNTESISNAYAFVNKVRPFNSTTPSSSHVGINLTFMPEYPVSDSTAYGITYMNKNLKSYTIYISREEYDSGIITNVYSDSSLTQNRTIYPSILERDKSIGSGSVLATTNTQSYTPTSNYHPATKKYVDDTVKVVDDKVNELELFKFPNATIVGTPTIQSGQVSDFTISDYLEFPFLVDFRNKPFEINFAFTTNVDVDTQQNILDSDFGLAFAIRNKHLVLAISYNGTSWATEQTGSLVLAPQTTYRIRMSWNGSVYKVEYSLNGGATYNTDINFSSSQQPYPKQMYIGVGKLANNYFKGSINMNYANVKVQDEIIWTGMDDVGLATRLATDMSNIDQAGIDYINSLIDAKITTALEGEY